MRAERERESGLRFRHLPAMCDPPHMGMRTLCGLEPQMWPLDLSFCTSLFLFSSFVFHSFSSLVTRCLSTLFAAGSLHNRPYSFAIPPPPPNSEHHGSLKNQNPATREESKRGNPKFNGCNGGGEGQSDRTGWMCA